MTPQAKIQEILDKCSQGNYIFRGETKKHEKVASGLYRQYCQRDPNNPSNHPPITNKKFSVFTVEEDIVKKAKQHIHPNAPNIEVLTELQHSGGKTALLDFTENILVALFFACDGNFEQDGRVICVETSDLRKESDIEYENFKENKNIYTIVPPTGKSSRVIFQQSIFVHTSKGYLEEAKCHMIEIEKDIKKPLLDYLRKYFGITTETIYNDIQGFIRNQDNYSTTEVEFYRGVMNHQEGKFKEAIENYNEAINHAPRHVVAYIYHNRGAANFALEQHKEAIQDYDEAIKINPQYASAYNNRGNAKSALEKHKEAIQDHGQAIELNPQCADAYNNRGAVKYILGQYKEAIQDYSQAIELDPQHASAYNNRGSAKYALKNHKEAIQDYDQAIKLNPKNAAAYNNRGNAKLVLEKHEEAIQDHGQAKKLYEKEGNMEMAGECEKLIAMLERIINNTDKKQP